MDSHRSVEDGELPFRLLIVGEVLWAGGVEIVACVPVPDVGLVVAAPEIEVREEDAVDVGCHFEISAGTRVCRRNGRVRRGLYAFMVGCSKRQK